MERGRDSHQFNASPADPVQGVHEGRTPGLAFASLLLPTLRHRAGREEVPAPGRPTLLPYLL